MRNFCISNEIFVLTRPFASFAYPFIHRLTPSFSSGLFYFLAHTYDPITPALPCYSDVSRVLQLTLPSPFAFTMTLFNCSFRLLAALPPPSSVSSPHSSTTAPNPLFQPSPPSATSSKAPPQPSESIRYARLLHHSSLAHHLFMISLLLTSSNGTHTAQLHSIFQHTSFPNSTILFLSYSLSLINRITSLTRQNHHPSPVTDTLAYIPSSHLHPRPYLLIVSNLIPLPSSHHTLQ